MKVLLAGRLRYQNKDHNDCHHFYDNHHNFHDDYHRFFMMILTMIARLRQGRLNQA